MRLFDSAQDLVAAQITKMYKDDRKGGKEIRNRLWSETHDRWANVTIGLFRRVLPDWRGTIKRTDGVLQVTRAYPSSRYLIHLDI